jgi:two-component system chemotaxis response regulator CheB
MILFCEECGTRHDIEPEKIVSHGYQFPCNICKETLIVTKSGKSGRVVHAVLQKDDLEKSTEPAEPLRILIVDDSKLIRKVLREIIESDRKNSVVGEAENGKQAIEIINEIRPDVITLDINMPVMDGLTTLKHIMINRPTPTVMISGLTKEGAQATFDSLKYGAIDFIPKPSQMKGSDLRSQAEEILKRITLSSEVQIESVRYLRRAFQHSKINEIINKQCRFVVVIGVAEGGYGALLNLIPSLHSNLPVSYIALMAQRPQYVDSFAEYLNKCSNIIISRVSDGIELIGGVCYLAAAEEYVRIERKGNKVILRVTYSKGQQERGHIDELMISASQEIKSNAAGVILTGNTDDGIEGIGAIIRNGGASFIQDPISCLYKRTPIIAAKKYAVNFLVSDKQMAGAILSYLMSRIQ